MKTKKKEEATDKSHETEPSQQSVLAGLKAELRAAEAEAAPVLAKIREYEEAILVLKHELGPKHDLSPEERIAKERELAEKEEFLKEWEKKLGSHITYNTVDAMNRGHTTAKIERLQLQLKEAHERAEGHRRKIAALESDEHVARIREKAEEKRKETKKLIENADRLEIERQAEIARERAELRRLTGSES